MNKTIENQYLKVEVASKGAELQSIFHKQMGKEILWQGEKEFWNRRSPIRLLSAPPRHEYMVSERLWLLS